MALRGNDLREATELNLRLSQKPEAEETPPALNITDMKTKAMILFAALLLTGSAARVLGIPQEPTGFSNDAQGVTGPPSFEECGFALRGDTTLVVHRR